jgi:hypothetical protein
VSLLAPVLAAATLDPARFRPDHGWHVGAVCDKRFPHGASRPLCRATTSRAATVRWHDCWSCFPPHRTLAALPPSGIAIVLTLEPPVRHARREMPSPPRIGGRVGGPFELAPSRVGGFVTGGRLHGFDVSLWVFFGRRHPSRRQIARAEAELRSARLP